MQVAIPRVHGRDTTAAAVLSAAVAARWLERSGRYFHQTREVEFDLRVLGQWCLLSLDLVHIRHRKGRAVFRLKLPSFDVRYRRSRKERATARLDLGIDDSSPLNGYLDFHRAIDVSGPGHGRIQGKI